MDKPRTLAEKIWDLHRVPRPADATTGADDLLHIDLHLMHEVTSPQAFDGLRLTGRPVRRPDLTLAVEDHNVPTDTDESHDPVGRRQLEALRRNCAEHGIELYRMGHARQGIVHVVAPQLGLVQPGMTAVCGDSHTSTLGAFGALAFGVGTSDVEHVLATQTLSLPRPRTMAAEFTGTLPAAVTAKDLILALIARIGPGGAQGHLLEYRGEALRTLSMEGRMTMCNMSIEAGARAGMFAPDEVTFAYLDGLPHAPAGRARQDALAHWRTLPTDPGAGYDRTVTIDVSSLSPQVSWGTNPGQTVPLSGTVPDPGQFAAPEERAAAVRALEYMDLKPGTALRDLNVDTVFVGSCTNGRLEDLRAAADVLRGRRLAGGTRMLVVPGSAEVRLRAEAEGLDRVFTQAGAEWRLPGCSMCPGLNPDRAGGRERVATTSNRNFEGRLGGRSRAHLVSPAVAAATAVAGRLAAPEDLT
ncbi:3-isopropylmalate dehydratase large subunit [Streptomyces sp. MMG1121]|uniref:3-isopropylmalate dehydratase large subunit n=1 Tax=Streptomyces sp. MMG1121 TaxID=1415544 RepID=UPI0006AFAD70|nr:3-isopropylmalate dehydratase large subunit [Streptomyces sp. MMG1121]KOV67960.1 isopropylmalate isomerase [Streptomyces sp. MMG1121]